MMTLLLTGGILAAGAFAVDMLLRKLGESQGGDGIPRIGGVDVRPLLAIGGILGGAFVPGLLGAVALAAGLGATVPIAWQQIKTAQLTDSGTSGYAPPQFG